MEQALKLLKADLGISGTQRDEYLTQQLTAAMQDLESRGVKLDLTAADDAMLLSDLTAWMYRHRSEDVGMAKNIEYRIKNRQVKKRCET